MYARYKLKPVLCCCGGFHMNYRCLVRSQGVSDNAFGDVNVINEISWR